MTDSSTEVAETEATEAAGSELVPSEGGALATSEAEALPEVVHEHAHPQPRQYVLIAVVLCVLTAMEVGLYYLEGDVNDNLLISMLWVLVFVKFFLVCSWYMHMRMDAPFFRRTFIVGILLAGFVYGVVLFTFASTVLTV